MISGQNRVYLVVAVAVLAVAIAGVGLYAQLSRRAGPGSLPVEATFVPPTPIPNGNSTAPTIEVVAERFAQRLQERGGTAGDWALLARSYVHLQRYPEAVEAFAHALEEQPGDAAFLAEQASARDFAANAKGRPAH